MQVKPRDSSTFKLKQVAGCHELKSRRLLGRLREALLHLEKGAQVPLVLNRRIWSHPLVCFRSFHTIQEIDEWAEQELLRTVRNVQTEQLQQWRQAMRTQPKVASKWTKKDASLPVTSVYDESFQEGAASQSTQESLRAMGAFWARIWDRDKPDPDDAFQFWQQDVQPAVGLPWTDLTANELHRQASRQRGSAGGCDGFHGDEIADLPLQAWNIVATLLTRWQARGEVPRSWQRTPNFVPKMVPLLPKTCALSLSRVSSGELLLAHGRRGRPRGLGSRHGSMTRHMAAFGAAACRRPSTNFFKILK